MAQTTQGKSPVRPASAHQRSLLAMEETMREEIRELQEQRAAAMMTEIVELQKERDLALGRAKRMEKKVKDVEAEAMQLRKTNSDAESRADLVGLLRQALVEEQLLSSDLKQKLQSVKKQNLSLSQQLQAAQSQPGSPLIQPSSRRNSFDSRNESSLLSSAALTPQPDRRPPSSHTKPPTPTTVTALTTHTTPDIWVDSSASSTTAAIIGSNEARAIEGPMSCHPMAYSPTVIPRRYKLTAVTSQEVGTQTPSDDQTTPPDDQTTPPDDRTTLPDDQTTPPPEFTASDSSQSEQPLAHTLAPPVLETLSLARADIVSLQRDRDTVQEELVKEVKKHAQFKKESESLQLECVVLRDALSEFSRWVRGKLGRMEENMDIFRVIYTLHGSLSQVQLVLNQDKYLPISMIALEQSVLQDLQSRLHQMEQKTLQLELANRHLTLAASEAEEKHQQSLSQIAVLQNKLSHISSPSHLTPPPSHLTRPHTTSSRIKGRQFSSPQLPLRHSIPASPLTTYTPSHPHTHDIV